MPGTWDSVHVIEETRVEGKLVDLFSGNCLLLQRSCVPEGSVGLFGGLVVGLGGGGEEMNGGWITHFDLVGYVG